MSATVRPAGRQAVTATIAATLAVIVLSPAALSFHSLTEYARGPLGLHSGWEFLVPVSVDAAALLCIALTFHATTRAESAGLARPLVWAFAVGSAVANWRSGERVSPDASWFFAAMPLAAALLLETVIRRVRSRVLAELGALETPLPRFRAVRWVVAPLETGRAWTAGVRHGITEPAAALAFSRERRALVGLSAADAARVAVDAVRSTDPATVRAWLVQRGADISPAALAAALPAAAVAAVEVLPELTADPMVTPAAGLDLDALRRELAAGPTAPVDEVPADAPVPPRPRPSRSRPDRPTAPVDEVSAVAALEPAAPGAPAPDVTGLSKRAALEAVLRWNGADVPAALEHLAGCGIRADRSDAYRVARAVREAAAVDRRGSVRILPGGGA